MVLAGACSLSVDFDAYQGGPGPGAGGSGEGGGANLCAGPQDCPPPAEACISPLCLDGVCGTIPTPTGTPSGGDQDEPCQAAVCDGQGAEVISHDDADVPADTPCTQFSCNEGTLVSSHLPLGEECDGAAGVCDGEGACRECNVAADCAGTIEESFCQRPACVAGMCVPELTEVNTPHPQQDDGDCRSRVCDGNGLIIEIADDDDPEDDGNECTLDTCNAGVPVSSLAVDGTTCGSGGMLACVAGECAGCTIPSQCGPDGECFQRTCDGAGQCGIDPLPPSTTISQVSGDCLERTCNGLGGVVTGPDDTDEPDDNNACTLDQCVEGAMVFPPRPLDTPCGSGWFCDGDSTCVECNNPTQCDDPGVCLDPICAGHQCGSALVPDGTPTGNQTAGDCKTEVCQQGMTSTQTSSGDLPVDGNACTLDQCNGSVPANPPSPAGTMCTGPSGATVCNGGGQCVACVSHTDCPADQYCDANRCVPDLLLGGMCTSQLQCKSGFCEDSVCCASACGVCKTCDAAGTCKNTKNYTDPRDECGSGVCFEGQCCGGAIHMRPQVDGTTQAEQQPPCPLEP